MARGQEVWTTKREPLFPYGDGDYFVSDSVIRLLGGPVLQGLVPPPADACFESTTFVSDVTTFQIAPVPI